MNILFAWVVGLILGAAAVWLLSNAKIAGLDERIAGRDREIADLKAQSAQKDASLQSQTNEVTRLNKIQTQLDTEKQGLLEKLKTDKADLENIQQKFEDRFKTLAHEILEAQQKKFQESGEAGIKSLVDPLWKQLKDLQEYAIEAKTLNQDMTKETKSLVTALRGDSTTQGRWGEMQLTHILDRSGLKEGEGYVIQGKGLGLKGEEEERQKPDVIINIPDPEKPKHLIIDSKVTLTAYDAYINSNDPDAKQQSLKDFLVSIRKHVDELGDKRYDRSQKLNSPDFVLMFVPIEGAFALAVQSDKEIFADAWDKHIVIVSPTTLLATLRTVAALWSQERASRNVLAIADRAGKLHEKFAGFLGDLEEVGKKLKSAQSSYDEAISKITGHGGLTSQVETLKTLGAKTSKRIDPKFLPNPEEDK
jgi:DNA recombination protein RmuC